MTVEELISLYKAKALSNFSFAFKDCEDKASSSTEDVGVNKGKGGVDGVANKLLLCLGGEGTVELFFAEADKKDISSPSLKLKNNACNSHWRELSLFQIVILQQDQGGQNTQIIDCQSIFASNLLFEINNFIMIYGQFLNY